MPETISEPEVWKDVLGYEGFYRASTHGRIMSYKRNGNINRSNDGEIALRPFIKKGYYVVNLSANNLRKGCGVHFLICKTFNEEPEYWECVEHLDSNPLNNFYKNLRFSTTKENVKTAVAAGSYKKIAEILRAYSTGRFGELNAATKAIIQMSMDGDFIKEHVSATTASKDLGISRQHISQCCTGSRKSCGGFKWKHKCIVT